MSMSQISSIILTVVLLVASATKVLAATFLPPGLAPGDKYHLIFTTAGQRDATAGDFETYEEFVNAEAAQSELTRDVAWRPIVSLADPNGMTPLHARDLVPTSEPIYTLGGTLFSASGLFDQPPVSTPNYDQFGSELNVSWAVATGTSGAGMAQQPLPTGHISVGTNYDLEDDGWIVDDDEPSTQLYHFYAVSEVITAVPEPLYSSTTLMVCGLMAFATARRIGAMPHSG
jgi:hypothetical protein